MDLLVHELTGGGGRGVPLLHPLASGLAEFLLRAMADARMARGALAGSSAALPNYSRRHERISFLRE
jgi:hypothetical protein